MKRAEITETKDLKYKNGYVECACGWRKVLGDGFNGYHIANCPKCTPTLETRNQRKVTTGSKKNGFKVELGNFTYFVISNGCHIQYNKSVFSTRYCSTERQADAISF